MTNTADITQPLGPRAEYEAAAARAIEAMEQSTNTDDCEQGRDRLQESLDNRELMQALSQLKIERPTRGWAGLALRGLGPQPDVVRPEVHEFPTARRYRVLPALTVIGALAWIIAVGYALPSWASTSVPALIAIAFIGTPATGWIGIGMFALLVVLGIIMFIDSKHDSELLLALGEELDFRLGCEHWTPQQRFRSCLQSGFSTPLNAVYSIVTFGALSLVGAVLMAVYLHEVRRTGDSREAAMVAAYFHADYERAVVVVAVAGLLTFVGIAMIHA